MKDWMELSDQLSNMAHLNHVIYHVSRVSPSGDILKNIYASFSFLAINRGGGQFKKTSFKLNIGGDQCLQINRGYQISRRD